MGSLDAHDLLTVQDRIQLFIDGLPVLSADDLSLLAEDACPICLVPFATLNDPTITFSNRAVTKLAECGHVFCRKDLTEWIRGQHGSCPACRHTFLSIRPPSESDDESSDGGEYMPPSDDFEDEDDGFLDMDGFTDAEEFTEGYAEDDVQVFSDPWDYDLGPPADMDEDVEIHSDVYGFDEGLTEGDSASMSDIASLEVDSQFGSALELNHSLEARHDGYGHEEVLDDIRQLDFSDAK
ncbi:hypothetical protein APHAL10511_001818 [Amanita phalloides]|nr:hypothetical protein APHAL10511_001818 [Amanita phalloides]